MRIRHSFVFSCAMAMAIVVCAAFPAPSHARGPAVPCTGVPSCAQMPLFDTPASGFWGNPDEIGIALHLFVQNGVMFGTYYGYTQTGAPVWYLFTDRLERPQGAPGLLHASTSLEEYRVHTCNGCPYTPPEQVGLPGSIELTFDQRNHGTYRIDGGEPIHIVPLEANSVFVSEFADEMRYALPDPEGAWVLTFKAEAGEGAPVERVGTISGVFGARRSGSSGNGAGTGWPFSIRQASTDPDPSTSLYCETENGSPPAHIPPQCQLRVLYSSSLFPEFGNGVRFPLPYANITGGRIVSEDPLTGIRLEAFRIGYD